MTTTNIVLLTVTVAAVGAVAWYVWQRERSAGVIADFTADWNREVADAFVATRDPSQQAMFNVIA